MTKPSVCLSLLIVCLLTFSTNIVSAKNYYVSSTGSNSNNGTSPSTPWQTIAKVNSSMGAFAAGDSIFLKKGDRFYTRLTITKSNLYFGVYGSGEAPLYQVSETGASNLCLVYLNAVSNVTIDGWKITDETMDPTDRVPLAKLQYAFYPDKCNNITIQNCDISLIGIGVEFSGTGNKFLNNKIYNLRTVKSTASPDYDDYGANGIVFSTSSDNLVTGNTFEGNWSYMLDFGNDGGAVEFYGPCSRNTIMYNKIIDCGGVGEFGSSSPGTCADNLIAYNLIVNCGLLSWCNIDGVFAVEVSNVQYFNNTIVSTPADRFGKPYLFAFNGSPVATTVFNLKNNIFYLSNGMDICSSGANKAKFAHDNNVYRFFTGSVANYTLNTTELSTTANIFTNVTGTDPTAWNYTPLATSPVVNFGKDLGLTTDFAGTEIVDMPEAGMLEVSSAISNPALTVTVTPGTINCNGGNATVTVSATGGTTPYTGTGTFTVTAGTYNYTVTDASGTATTKSVTISQPTALAATVTSGIITLLGGTTSVTTTATGGTSPYTYSINGGAFQSSNIFALVLAGVHSVIVKDAKGCTVTKSLTITQPAASLSATATGGTISCNGGNTTVTVAATGGVTPYTGTGTFTVTAGTYNYTVTDANGTAATTTITVSQPAALSVTATAGAITVYGGTTTVTVTATGGTTAYTYSIDGGAYQSTNSFTAIAAGVHTVTVKDAKGCTATKSLTITQPGDLVAAAVAGTISCNGGNTTVTVTATGGVAPYTGTGSFTVTAGTYSYTVTDANGATDIATVTIGQPTALTVTTAAGTITVFGGTTTVAVTATGGTTAYTYSIDGGAYQSGNSFTAVAAGAHTVTVKDAKGCTATKSFNIAQPGDLIATAAAGTISCNGATTTVTVAASGGVAPYTGTGSFTVTAGTYTYTVKDANGATEVATVTVNQPTSLTVAATAGTITAFGGSTTITVTATGGTTAYTYSLNGGAYQAANSFSNVKSGTHTVTVKDAKGCTSAKSITITQPADLVAAATAGTINCNGGNTTVTVTATGGVAPYTGTGTFTVTDGDYSYTVTDANGTTKTTTVTVTEPAAITVSLTAGTITAAGGSTNIATTATGGSGSYTYSLNGGAYQSSNSFAAVIAGTHTVTIKDAKGCTASKSITITQPGALSAAAAAGTISCNGGTTTVAISATGGVAPYTGTGNFTVTAGTYNFAVTDANGIIATTTVTVAQPAVIAVTLTAGTITTNGGSTTLTVSATGGSGSYTYSLNGGTYQASASFTGVKAGTHSVTVKDTKGCTAVKSITIAQPGTLAATATSGTISCNGSTTTVTVAATGGLTPYTGTGTFTVTAGTYNYIVTDANGATTTTTVTVNQPTAIIATVATGTIAVAGGTTTVTATASGGSGSYTYSLNGGAYQSSVTFNNVLAGSHSLTVKDAKGCTAVRNFSITEPGVENVTAAKFTLKAYPNPSNSEFTLTIIGGRSSQTVEITVLNMVGNIVYKAKGNAGRAYKFGSRFNAGTYVLKVTISGVTQTLKLVKVN